MKGTYIFGAGLALGVLATRRTRRAKEAARAALAAKLTPSAIAADVRQGAANRRASYRPMIDAATGALAMLPPDRYGPQVLEPAEDRAPQAVVYGRGRRTA